MSRSSRTTALVCEGYSDLLVVRRIVQTLWPEVDDVLPLQPQVDALGQTMHNLPRGWSAVRDWCKQNAETLAALIDPGIGDPLSLLVVCLDVDIAVDAGIADPPVHGSAYDAARLCATMRSWLVADEGRAKLPPELAIAIPAMAIEAWAIAALYPREKRPEQIEDPAGFLVSKGQLKRNQRGKPAKPRETYERFGRAIAGNLDRVRRVCPEAHRLCRKIEHRRRAVGDGHASP
jgi:hypothetical protein